MADSSIRANISILKSRARGVKYIPARAMANTLTDPAKLLLIIPPATSFGSRGVLRPEPFDPAVAVVAPKLLEITPPQAPKGLLVATNKGTADAIPSWVDGFAAIPQEQVAAGYDEAKLQQTYLQSLLTFGRVVWKGDEEIMRAFFLGDCQRKEGAFALQSDIAGDVGGYGSFQAACGTPGNPVYNTPGYVYTGRASCDFYIENTGAAINNTSSLPLVVAVYVYGQFVLNIDPMQTGTADAIRGGTFGAMAGNCQDNAVNALEGSVNRMPPPSAQSVRKTSIRCG